MRKLEITPAPCLICGAGNTPDSHGERREFIDLERDVNWNDPAILCEDCLAQAASLIGMLSQEAMKKMQRELKLKDEEAHDLQVEINAMRKRAKRVGVVFESVTP